MKKNSLITFIISLVVVAIIVVIEVFILKEESILTCVRDGEDEVVFIFDADGLNDMKINGKKVSKGTLLDYKYGTISLSDSYFMNDYSYYDKVREYKNRIAKYEEDSYDFYSVCDFDTYDSTE